MPPTESLEQKAGNPHWSQWIPLYGVGALLYAESKGKPNIWMDAEQRPVLFFGGTAYHTVVSFIPAVCTFFYGLSKLLEKL